MDLNFLWTFITESIDNNFFSYLAINTSILGNTQADGHLNNWKLSKPLNISKFYIVKKLI